MCVRIYFRVKSLAMFKLYVSLLLLMLLHVCNVTADRKDVVYHVSIDGQPDFELHQGANPCMAIKYHCSSGYYAGSLQYDTCFAMLHARVSTHLGHHWSVLHEKLKVNENLFIQCSEHKFEPQNSGSVIVRQNEWMDKREILIQQPYLSPNDSNLVVQQLLEHMGMLIKNDSFDEKQIALFESHNNELALSKFQKVEMYRQALLKFPTNLFIVSQFGLALMSIGFEKDARMLFHNAVTRGLWDDPLQRPVFKYVRGLTSKPWHNKYDFSFTPKLENGAKQIKSELFYNLENHKHLFMVDYENMPLSGNWKAIKLISNDGQQTKYTKYFPKTMEIIDKSGQEFISIKFSAIQPGTHIAPHTGPSNDRLRVHLSLVHKGGARIRVGTEWRSWEEEKVIILDSSWEHEVVHNGNETRIVLILDIWHPELIAN